jgi:hypothetical protein
MTLFPQDRFHWLRRSDADQLRRLAFVVMILFTTSVCAQGLDAPARRNNAISAAASDAVSKWVGTYEPHGRACARDVLRLEKSRFSWMDCKAATIHLVTTSDTEVVFEVDPTEKCGWAGWIVTLTASSSGSRAVSVSAYRSLKDLQAKEYKAFCSYYKISD